MTVHQHADAVASAASTAVKLAGIWGGVVAGFSALPWAQIAAALAGLYSLHLIVGWWLDRLGRRGPRKGRR